MSAAVSLHAPLLTARYGFFAQVSYASADVGSIPTVSSDYFKRFLAFTNRHIAHGSR
jgi:hypothetical protein